MKHLSNIDVRVFQPLTGIEPVITELTAAEHSVVGDSEIKEAKVWLL